MARSVAITNQKGGVGKTTTAVNLGACLAAAGQRCLVVDLDPQGNAGVALGAPRAGAVGANDVILHGRRVGDVLHRTPFPNLDLLLANSALADIEKRIPEGIEFRDQLARAFEEVSANYDFFLIDCPPAQGVLSTLALHAADALIIPIQCESFALDALEFILSSLKDLQRARNGVPVLQGILCTMFDERLEFAQSMVREVRERHRGEVFKAMIPRDIALSEAATLGLPALRYDPTSRGTIGYVKLAKEVLRNEGKTTR